MRRLAQAVATEPESSVRSPRCRAESESFSRHAAFPRNPEEISFVLISRGGAHATDLEGVSLVYRCVAMVAMVVVHR